MVLLLSRISIFLFLCPFSNVCDTMLTSPLEIHHLKLFNFLADRSVALIYPYSLINLTLMAKKCIFTYEN